MGRVMEHGGAIEGYEAVPLALPEDAGPLGSGAAVLRRRSARPGRRAVVYVHCRGDSFVPDDLVSWYTDRGFHFYAADLRGVGADERAGHRCEPGRRRTRGLLRLPGRGRRPRARDGRDRHHDRVRARNRRRHRRAVVPRPARQQARPTR